MALEGTFDYPDDLVAANPANGDDIDEGAAHLRGIKNVIRNFASDFTGAPLNKSILSALFPQGVCIILNGNSGNPGNQLGGTWSCFGQLKTLATADEDPTVPGTFPEEELYVWYRIA
jgi:hypothetical protein